MQRGRKGSGKRNETPQGGGLTEIGQVASDSAMQGFWLEKREVRTPAFLRGLRLVNIEYVYYYALAFKQDFLEKYRWTSWRKIELNKQKSKRKKFSSELKFLWRFVHGLQTIVSDKGV